MSDDLIRRKAVIEAVDRHTREDGTLDDDISVILEEVESAFDKERLMEVLKEYKKIMLSPMNRDCFGEECEENDFLAGVFNKAIEIVEKGGVG